MLNVKKLKAEHSSLVAQAKKYLRQADALEALIATMGGFVGNGGPLKFKSAAKPAKSGKGRKMSAAAKKKLAAAARARWAKAKASGKNAL